MFPTYSCYFAATFTVYRFKPSDIFVQAPVSIGLSLAVIGLLTAIFLLVICQSGVKILDVTERMRSKSRMPSTDRLWRVMSTSVG